MEESSSRVWGGKSTLKSGDGLGVDKTGITDCVQLGRRAEMSGLGFNNQSQKAQEDGWWQDVYNKSIKGISKKSKQNTSNGKAIKSRGTLDHSEIAESVKRRRESMCAHDLTEEEYNHEDEELFGEFIKLVTGSKKKSKISK